MQQQNSQMQLELRSSYEIGLELVKNGAPKATSTFEEKNEKAHLCSTETRVTTTVSVEDAPVAKKKRKSRWGDEREKVAVVQTLPAHISEEQRKHYFIQFKIEEVTLKLRNKDFDIPDDEERRSPSPEPEYNQEGRRTNTRADRARMNMQQQRFELIKQAIDEIPNYVPPTDYRPPKPPKPQAKIFLPKVSGVSIIGSLLGPRGNTLKRLSQESNCKIIICGNGSVREGSTFGMSGKKRPGEGEPLHVSIRGETEADLEKGKEMVSNFIRDVRAGSDAANQLRVTQLNELRELNGLPSLGVDVLKCKNCGQVNHRHWECTEVKRVSTQLRCSTCGGYGHVESDCLGGDNHNNDNSSSAINSEYPGRTSTDSDYLSLMKELGVEMSTSKAIPSHLNGALTEPVVKSEGSIQVTPAKNSSATLNTRSSWPEEKIILPNDGVNYIGKLLGMGGSVHRRLQNETNCKISIFNNQGTTRKEALGNATPVVDGESYVTIRSPSVADLQFGVGTVEAFIKELAQNQDGVKKLPHQRKGEVKDPGPTKSFMDTRSAFYGPHGGAPVWKPHASLRPYLDSNIDCIGRNQNATNYSLRYSNHSLSSSNDGQPFRPWYTYRPIINSAYTSDPTVMNSKYGNDQYGNGQYGNGQSFNMENNEY